MTRAWTEPRHCGTRQKGTVDGISMVARVAGLRHWLSRAVVDIVARHGQRVAIGDGARSAPRRRGHGGCRPGWGETAGLGKPVEWADVPGGELWN